MHEHRFDPALGICPCVPGVVEQTLEREFRGEAPENPGPPAMERIWADIFVLANATQGLERP